MKYRVIRENAVHYSIEEMCRILHVSRSGYYEWSCRGDSVHTRKDRELKATILAIYQQYKRRYGSPRIYDELRDRKIRCGKKRIERLMRELGLQARPKRHFKVTTDSNHHYRIAPNLLNRQFHANAPNRVWTADITYIRTFEGWLYLATIMDLCSRRIIGWAMSETLKNDFVISTLRMAIQSRRPAEGLLHHSDRGVQYASDDYQALLHKHQMICSMSRKGNCWDNAPMESFFSTLKIECVSERVYLSKAQARREIFEFIEIDYNRKRRHSSIGSMSPENFEKLSISA
jgi:putative transposase